MSWVRLAQYFKGAGINSQKLPPYRTVERLVSVEIWNQTFARLFFAIDFLSNNVRC